MFSFTLLLTVYSLFLYSYLYWTDSGLYPSVNRAQLDGTNQQSLITNNVIFPGSIAIHPHTNHIYWAENHIDHRAIWRADREGSGATALSVPGSSDNVVGLTFLGNVLYWSDGLHGRIRKTNTNSQFAGVITSYQSLPGVRGVIAVNDSLPLGV